MVSKTDRGVGGQFHWVSEFSPKRFQRGLSYIVGKYAFEEARGDQWQALIASRLAWSIGLGGWCCHFELSGRDANTRSVYRGELSMIYIYKL